MSAFGLPPPPSQCGRPLRMAPYLVDPSVSVLVEHGEGDLEPGQRLYQNRQQEEVLAVARKIKLDSSQGDFYIVILTCMK